MTRVLPSCRIMRHPVRMIHAPWIEAFNYHHAIYEEFGGVVASTKFGPDPAGAKQALAENLEQSGKLEIVDPKVREAFWNGLRKPPRFVVENEQIDFTPFWKQPTPE